MGDRSLRVILVLGIAGSMAAPLVPPVHALDPGARRKNDLYLGAGLASAFREGNHLALQAGARHFFAPALGVGLLAGYFDLGPAGRSLGGADQAVIPAAGEIVLGIPIAGSFRPHAAAGLGWYHYREGRSGIGLNAGVGFDKWKANKGFGAEARLHLTNDPGPEGDAVFLVSGVIAVHFR